MLPGQVRSGPAVTPVSTSAVTLSVRHRPQLHRYNNQIDVQLQLCRTHSTNWCRLGIDTFINYLIFTRSFLTTVYTKEFSLNDRNHQWHEFPSSFLHSPQFRSDPIGQLAWNSHAGQVRIHWASDYCAKVVHGVVRIGNSLSGFYYVMGAKQLSKSNLFILPLPLLYQTSHRSR